MKKYTLILASATFLLSSTGWAQQQYDSLGSPTPAPNQAASPNAVNPNKPVPGNETTGSSSVTESQTTGSAAGSSGSTSGLNEPANAGTSLPADGHPPGGLTPE